MKSATTTVVLMALLLTTVTHAQQKADLYLNAKKTGKGELICLFNQTSGYAYRNENGEMAGFCVNLMQRFKVYLREVENIDVELKFIEEKKEDFGSFLNQVKSGNGGVFGIGNITITDQRKKNYKVSAPVMRSVTVIVTHRDVPDFSSLRDLSALLNGWTGYSVKGTTFEKRLEEIQKQYCPSMQLQTKQPGLDSFKKILIQKKTIQNIDFINYLALLKQNMPLKRQMILDAKEEVGVVMGNTNDWDAPFNKFLSAFVDSMSYRKLISDNFGTSALKFLDSVEGTEK